MFGKRHRRARVEYERRRHVRRLAKLFRVDAVGPRDELPVDVLQIVAGPIVAILTELRAVAVKRTSMQSRHEPLDDDSRNQLQIAYSSQDLLDVHGDGTVSSRRATI